MPFTIPEALSDLPELLDLIQTIQAAVATTDKSEGDKVLDTIDVAIPKLTALVRKIIKQTAD